MDEMMTFPDTWEEFEKSYGFTDNEEVYTNGARLIPSFRVKQWLDHLPSVQPDVPDTNVGEITKPYYSFKYVDEDGEEYIDHFIPPADLSDYCDKLWKLAYERGKAEGRGKGKWIGKEQYANSQEYFSWECDKCEWVLEDITLYKPYSFCPNCGADMRERKEDE